MSKYVSLEAMQKQASRLLVDVYTLTQYFGERFGNIYQNFKCIQPLAQ